MRTAFLTSLALAATTVACPTLATAQEAGEGFVKIGLARTKLVDKGEVAVNGTVDPTAGYETRATWHGTLSAGYFVIDHVALEASVSTPATTDNLPAGSLAGTPNLGDDEFVVATLGASFHPLKGAVSPYVGGGFQYQFTTQERDGLGVNLNIPNSHGPYVHAGVNVRLAERLGAYVDVRKAFYHTNASGLLPLDATYTNFAQVNAKAELDPLTIQAGVMTTFGGAPRAGAPTYAAGDEKWVIRAGISHLELADKAQMVVGGAPLAGEGISTYEHLTASVQVGYFFTPNFAVNATLGLPPKVEIFGAGSIGALPKLGEIRYGPTALTLQYHPIRSGRIRPYIGAGISYMIVFGNKDGAFQDLKVNNDLSAAFEVGSDLMINNRLGLFADVKKAFLRPTASGTFGGAPVEVKTKIDPWVFTGGLSFRF